MRLASRLRATHCRTRTGPRIRFFAENAGDRRRFVIAAAARPPCAAKATCYTLTPYGVEWRVFMRSKLIGLVLGLGLAAIVGPALACNYGTSAENSKTTSQETAQSQPAPDTGSN
jgi:hypothetical protein